MFIMFIMFIIVVMSGEATGAGVEAGGGVACCASPAESANSPAATIAAAMTCLYVPLIVCSPFERVGCLTARPRLREPCALGAAEHAYPSHARANQLPARAAPTCSFATRTRRRRPRLE